MQLAMKLKPMGKVLLAEESRFPRTDGAMPEARFQPVPRLLLCQADHHCRQETGSFTVVADEADGPAAQRCRNQRTGSRAEAGAWPDDQPAAHDQLGRRRLRRTHYLGRPCHHRPRPPPVATLAAIAALRLQRPEPDGKPTAPDGRHPWPPDGTAGRRIKPGRQVVWPTAPSWPASCR